MPGMGFSRFERVLALFMTLSGVSCGRTSEDPLESPLDGAGGSGASAAASSGGSDGAAAAAGDAGGATQGPSGGRVALGCAEWGLLSAPGNPTSATVVDGALLLERPDEAETPSDPFYRFADLAVNQGGLSGDFEITVEWQDFQPGGAVGFVGAQVKAGVWWVGSPGAQALATVGQGTATAQIVQDDGPEEFNINYLEPRPSTESLVGASGTFHISRSGTFVFVKTTVNGQTVSAASSEPFIEEPLALFLAIGNSDFDEGMGDASIRITNVTVVGGGGLVESDDFSCP
jgi:hypothetical protein